MNEELTPEEIQYRWYNAEPIRGVAFLLNDPVVVVTGPHAGNGGFVISLEGREPEPRYLVELGSGAGDLVLAQSDLASPVPPDIGPALSWLRLRYASQCDGDWEHDEGPRIETLDNPGWLVRIPLAGTELEGKAFPAIERHESDRVWLSCRVSDTTFEGAGGPHMLGEVLAEFMRWA